MSSSVTDMSMSGLTDKLFIWRDQKERNFMKKPFERSLWLAALALLFTLTLGACGGSAQSSNGSGQTVVNLGYFPNVTHAVAIVGVARGTFQSALGSNVTLD